MKVQRALRSLEVEIIRIEVRSERLKLVSKWIKLRYPLYLTFLFTTGGGIGEFMYENTSRVVIAWASFLGYGMVLLGDVGYLLPYRKNYWLVKEFERGLPLLTLESLDTTSGVMNF
ncbi:hypothetical protein Tco_1156792 [Tanacetum coccineum]